MNLAYLTAANNTTSLNNYFILTFIKFEEGFLERSWKSMIYNNQNIVAKISILDVCDVHGYTSGSGAQLTFTYSKSTIQTLEEGLKYVQG